MVREIRGFYIDVDPQEPRRPEISAESEFCHQTVRDSDLVDAFLRFVSKRSGSFERLLNTWVSGRLKAGMPVNLENPDSDCVPPRLKKALKAGFDRERSSRRTSK